MTGYYNTDKIIAGIDLSLRNTGLIIINSAGEVLHREIIKGDKVKGIARLKLIKDTIITRLKQFNVTAAAIENYSFGSRGRATFSIGECGGSVRLALFENGYSFFDIPPSSLKAFITDDGSADKIMVQEWIDKTYGIYFKNDNEADAYGLARMTLCLGDETAKFCKKGGAKLIRTAREKLSKENKKLV